MSWFTKIFPSPIKSSKTKQVPDGIWVKCPKCQEVLYRNDLEKNFSVCRSCDHHLSISARKRIEHFLDDNTWEECFTQIKPTDPLNFKDSKRYKDRLSEAQKQTQENDALVCAKGRLDGIKVVVVVFDFKFMGGSMGSVVGEKFTRSCKLAIEEKRPLICFSASGGARMQEGMVSLMQMAKTSVAISQMQKEGVPFISVLTNPTMGGVSASLAMLGDIILAEKGATIGFAGKRVIENTVKESLPEGFQTAEFLFDNGLIDQVVHRGRLKKTIVKMLKVLNPAPTDALAFIHNSTDTEIETIEPIKEAQS